MKDDRIWPVRRTRWLPPPLVLVTLLAGAAAAQMTGNRMHQQREQSVPGVTLDDAVKQLASPDPAQRLQAVKALGTSKDSKAVDHLIKALGDSDLRVLAKAVQVLSDMRATEATPVLMERLLMRTTDSGMKQLILATLGKIGDPRAARPLIQLLQRDLDVETRGTAIFALGDIGSPEAVEVLEHIEETDEDPTVRRVANEARGKIEGRHGMMNSPLKEDSAGR